MTPSEPLSPIAEAAVQLHEVYLALLVGGFTPDEAIKIVCFILAQQLSS